MNAQIRFVALTVAFGAPAAKLKAKMLTDTHSNVAKMDFYTSAPMATPSMLSRG